MSQENVEIVRSSYERWGELGDLDHEFLDPEIEWRGPREFPDLAEPHYGHDGVRRHIEKVNEVFEDYRMFPEEFLDARDE
ncbi:MAG: nuclear transport factor 2 family protein [Solirubrobacterales bacterium]